MSDNCKWQKVIRTSLLRLQILLIAKEIIHLERLFSKCSFTWRLAAEIILFKNNNKKYNQKKPELRPKPIKKPHKLCPLLQNLDYSVLPIQFAYNVIYALAYQWDQSYFCPFSLTNVTAASWIYSISWVLCTSPACISPTIKKDICFFMSDFLGRWVVWAFIWSWSPEVSRFADVR